MASGKRTPEYRKIQDNYAKICSTLTDHVPPGDLGNKLFSARLIGNELKRAAGRGIIDEGERINKLLAAVHNQIELKSANFSEFIKILEEYTQLEELLKDLRLGSEEETTAETVQQQPKQSEETSGELRLKEKDLGVLTDILKGAVTKWKVIGLALGFLDAELTEIEHKPLLIPEGDTGYFREMLSRWLKWAPSNHPWPTLEALASALNKAGEESLAYDLKEQYLSQNGNANATPSTVHPSNTRKHVAPYRASPRDGLRPTSSDLEPKKESKPHEAKPHPTDHIPKQSYCPSWKWYGGICIAVGVAAVLIAAVKLNPDVVNILTTTGTAPTVLDNRKTSPGDPEPTTEGPPLDCHKISNKQELGRAVATIGDWETLYENLGTPEPVLKQLRFDGIPTEVKRSRCLEAYLNTDKACWETVVKVVADYPFYNKKLARKIANEHGVDYSSIVKEEL